MLLEKLKTLLDKILTSDRNDKMKYISKFQDLAWNDVTTIKEDELNELLSSIAYDLDFYEPNEKYKTESLDYFGENRLESILKNALKKLNNYRL